MHLGISIKAFIYKQKRFRFVCPRVTKFRQKFSRGYKRSKMVVFRFYLRWLKYSIIEIGVFCVNTGIFYHLK